MMTPEMGNGYEIVLISSQWSVVSGQLPVVSRRKILMESPLTIPAGTALPMLLTTRIYALLLTIDHGLLTTNN